MANAGSGIEGSKVMTDEQLKKLKQAFTDIGYAIADIGDALGMYADPEPDDDGDPVDPPVDPPIDPPPPPVEEETEFEKAVVLKRTAASLYHEGRYEPGQGQILSAVQGTPTHNVCGKSWGLSFKVFHHSPPTGTSPLSLWDDSSPQWQVKCPGPTRLAVAFALTGGGYSGFDVVVDDLTNRWAHVVVGYYSVPGTANLWVDGVLRGAVANLPGIGHSPDSTPPLIVNSTAAGHAAGDISIDNLEYAVGGAPIQIDVDKRLGVAPKPDGPSNGVTDGIAWAEMNGAGFADLPLTDPLSFIDGRHVPMKRVVNNPPRTVRYEGEIPSDIGREVK